MKSASIPKKIRFHCRKPEKATFCWDDLDTSESIGVIPAFACDIDNEKTNETAKSWAEGYSWQGKREGYTVVEFDNDPIDDIKIIGLEHRSEGGRAYKVILRGNYYFDLREDVLLDTILECGITKGGRLRGKFIFCQIGSQMKIVRYGSKLHDEAIKLTNRKNLTKIPNKELKIGYKYKTKSGETGVYLGRAKDPTDNKNKLVFAGAWVWNREPEKEDFDQIELKNSHSYVEELDDFELTFDIVRKKKIDQLKKWVKEEEDRKYEYIKNQKEKGWNASTRYHDNNIHERNEQIEYYKNLKTVE